MLRKNPSEVKLRKQKLKMLHTNKSFKAQAIIYDLKTLKTRNLLQKRNLIKVNTLISSMSID